MTLLFSNFINRQRIIINAENLRTLSLRALVIDGDKNNSDDECIIPWPRFRRQATRSPPHNRMQYLLPLHTQSNDFCVRLNKIRQSL